MITDTPNVRATPRASVPPGGRIAAKPDYILLAIGLILVLVQILATSGRVASPVANAVLLGLGVTLALYGVCPASVIRGKFTGLLGSLAVTGPAALGIFLIAFTSNALQVEYELQQAGENAVLLTTSTIDPRHNSRTIGGTTISLLDVDSFADERINEVVDHLESTLRSNGISDEKALRQEVRSLLASMIPHLRLGQPHEAKALAAVDAYLRRQPGANDDWKAAVAEAAASAADPKRVVNRVKKLPFAVMKITEKSKPKFLALSESDQVPVGSRTYNVPVIANPARRYVPNLEEAVVLIAEAQ